jgi:predicted nucleotidyltransferase
MDNKLIKSFTPKDELNSKIWDGDGKNAKLKPLVRKKLLEVSEQFLDFLNVDMVVTDIIMIGSLVNYNWSEYSDIDLHIVVNFSQFPENAKDLYVEFFDLKKVIFNEKHNIKFFGYDVECYVQDEVQTTFSSGVYSVLFDEWANVPKKENVKKIDKNLLKQKSKQWMRIIDGVLENIEDETPDNIKKIVDTYKAKLKKFRKCGLEKGGEMGLENLVYKVLRRNGYIEKLYNQPTEFIDNRLSLKQ